MPKALGGAGPQVDISVQPAWSWNTKFSRTSVSTVRGLGLTESAGAHSVDSLDGVLNHVRALRVQRCAFDEIEDAQPIGEGETFSVEKAFYRDTTVAVKHIKFDSGEEGQKVSIRRRLQSVLREILIMHHPPLAHHPNILGLVGYGWRVHAASPLPYILVDYGSQGTLRTYLANRRVNLRTKMILAGDVAAGLMALHQCGIVHGDMKLDNIIVFETWDRPSMSIAKISDFGHSSLPREDETERRRYYGTAIYNAPEVARQKTCTIENENLHKCDIWAYGLLVWEVLLDGASFFQQNWRQNLEYAPSLKLGDLSDGSLQLVDSIGSTESLWGSFDMSRLKDLAKAFVQRLPTSSHFEKAYLKPLFERALQVDPQKRLSDLSRLPLVSLWNAVGTAPLHSKLAIRAGSGELTFDMFRPDIGRDILWEHQKEILVDLEKIATQEQLHGQQGNYAFQAAVCYMTGFGCAQDRKRATNHLRKAQDENHLITRLFGKQLLSVIARQPMGNSSYTRTIAGHFRMLREFGSKLTIYRSKDPEKTSYTAKEFPSWVENTKGIDEQQDLYVMIGVSPKLKLLEAAIAIDDETLVGQLANSESINEIGAWGETPLIQACRRSNASIARLLLEKGAQPGIASSEGWTAFHWLFMLDDDEVLDMFFCSKASNLDTAFAKIITIHPQWPLMLGGTPLGVAVQTGSVPAVKCLLSNGASICCPAFEESPPSRWTALHLAAKYQFSELLRLFKDRHDLHAVDWPIASAMSYTTSVERYAIHGTQFRTQISACLSMLGKIVDNSLDGKPPLMQAIDFNDTDLIALLLEYTPELASCRLTDPEDASSYNYPIHFAAQINARRDVSDATAIIETIWRLDKLALRRRDSDLRLPLHLAATGSSSLVTQWLIQKGAVIDSVDRKARTALHYASSAANIKTLVAHGADVNLVDVRGFASVHLAAMAAAEDRLAELIRSGAQLDLDDNLYGTPLHCAVYNRSRSAVAVLLEHDAPANSVDRFGNTPLMLAIQAERIDLVRMLLDHGASSSVANDEGITPLLASVSLKLPHIIEQLLGAPQTTSFEPELPHLLHQSTFYGDQRSLSVILEQCRLHNVPISCRNPKNSQTVLHVAALAANVELAAMLIEGGCDVDSRDADGSTPLHTACKSATTRVTGQGGSRPRFCEILLGRGADILATDNNGINAWAYAAVIRDFGVLTTLARGAVCSGVLGQLVGENTLTIGLVKAAIRDQEWDFITTCIAYDLLTSSVMNRLFGDDIAIVADFARQRDKAMVEWRLTKYEMKREEELRAEEKSDKALGMRQFLLEYQEKQSSILDHDHHPDGIWAPSKQSSRSNPLKSEKLSGLIRKLKRDE